MDYRADSTRRRYNMAASYIKSLPEGSYKDLHSLVFLANHADSLKNTEERKILASNIGNIAEKLGQIYKKSEIKSALADIVFYLRHEDK